MPLVPPTTTRRPSRSSWRRPGPLCHAPAVPVAPRPPHRPSPRTAPADLERRARHRPRDLRKDRSGRTSRRPRRPRCGPGTAHPPARSRSGRPQRRHSYTQGAATGLEQAVGRARVSPPTLSVRARAPGSLGPTTTSAAPSSSNPHRPADPGGPTCAGERRDCTANLLDAARRPGDQHPSPDHRAEPAHGPQRSHAGGGTRRGGAGLDRVGMTAISATSADRSSAQRLSRRGRHRAPTADRSVRGRPQHHTRRVEPACFAGERRAAGTTSAKFIETAATRQALATGPGPVRGSARTMPCGASGAYTTASPHTSRRVAR